MSLLRRNVAKLQAECVDDPEEIAGDIAAEDGLLEAIDSAISALSPKD